MTQIILGRIERNIFESGRLINNEKYASAITILNQCRVNLNRIVNTISSTRFNTINDNIIQLLSFCENRMMLHVDSSTSSYTANRIIRGRGRPSVEITREQIHCFLSEGYNATKIAKRLNCSKSVIYRRLYENGFKFRDKYSNISNEDLHRQIRQLNADFPNIGSEMMCGYLKSKGIVVQRAKVRGILSTIDPVGTASRWSCAVQRRTYSVPTPNALWHIDAHLKLVRWGIITHGCIDGYSRLLIYVKCTTSITAESVINIFMPAVAKYGFPSRVKSDHGYENLFVAILMNLIRGTQRSSHITGKSVHNQRIERLWRDVYNQVISTFYEQFYRLEAEGELDAGNEVHRYILQLIYVKEINKSLSSFRKAWNSHKMRTENRRTPRELWLEGILENINSNYTSVNEIFTNQETTEERVRTALINLGMPLDQMVIQAQEDYSSLTARINLSNQQENFIRTIMESNRTAKEKYISSVQYLSR